MFQKYAIWISLGENLEYCQKRLSQPQVKTRFSISSLNPLGYYIKELELKISLLSQFLTSDDTEVLAKISACQCSRNDFNEYLQSNC